MYAQDLTKGNISRHLTTLAVPLILGNILQQFYNTIDAFVIAQFAGKEEFAAIGIAGTVMNLFLFAIVGGCSGFSVLFAQHYGAGDKAGLRKQHFTTLVAGLSTTFVLEFLGLVFLSPLLELIQTPIELQGYTAIYLKWIFFSLPAAFLYNFYASMLRSVGDTKAALFILAVAVFANLVLDIIFVAGFDWGIEGAAIATALTQLFAAILCFAWLLYGYRDLLFGKQDCKLEQKSLRIAMHFGSVTALHQSGLYIGKMLVQGAVNTAGTDVIAAYTAATRIEGFANSFGDSGAVATSIVTANNHGAKKVDRVEQTFWSSLKLLTGLGIVCSIILFVTATKTIEFMLGTNEGTAFLEAVNYLQIVSVFYVLCFVGNTFAGYFDGIGRVSIPFAGAVSHITLRVILSWIFISQFQLNAVAVATGIGWVLVNLIWTLVKIYLARKKQFGVEV